MHGINSTANESWRPTTRAESSNTGSDYVEIHDGVRCPGVLSTHAGSMCLNGGNPGRKVLPKSIEACVLRDSAQDSSGVWCFFPTVFASRTQSGLGSKSVAPIRQWRVRRRGALACQRRKSDPRASNRYLTAPIQPRGGGNQGKRLILVFKTATKPGDSEIRPIILVERGVNKVFVIFGLLKDLLKCLKWWEEESEGRVD